MKTLINALTVVCALALSASPAIAKDSDDIIFEAAAGTSNLGAQSPVGNLLLRVFYTDATKLVMLPYVSVEIQGNQNPHENQLRSLDVGASLVHGGVGAPENGKFRGGVHVFNIDYVKTIKADTNEFYSIGILGGWFASEVELNKDFRLLIKGVVDVLATGIVKHISGQTGFADTIRQGNAPTLNTEAVLEFKKRYRIILGERALYASGKKLCWDNPNTCVDSNPSPDGYAVYSRTSLGASADLTKHFNVFGRASYSIFELSADDGTNDSNHDQQLLVGVGGRF
jgi:hypothetical protein